MTDLAVPADASVIHIHVHVSYPNGPVSAPGSALGVPAADLSVSAAPPARRPRTLLLAVCTIGLVAGGYALHGDGHPTAQLAAASAPAPAGSSSLSDADAPSLQSPPAPAFYHAGPSVPARAAPVAIPAPKSPFGLD